MTHTRARSRQRARATASISTSTPAGGRIAAAVGAIVLRVLSALTAVPAFLFDGVPTGPKVLAGIAITLTVVGSVLVLADLRRPVPAVVR